jgi:xylulokinase
MRWYWIGIDIGTSRLKAGVIDETGRVRATRSIAIQSSFDGDGHAVQDLDQLIDSVHRIIRRVCDDAVIKPESVAALGFDGQMGGIIGVDHDFEPVTGLDLGLDLSAERLNEQVHREHADQLISISCGSPRNAPKIAWWKRTHPEVYARVRRFTSVAGYVAGVLTGLHGDDAYIDDTMIAYFGNENATARGWSEELTALWGIDEEKLPQIREPWELIGSLTARSARATGLREGTPIVAGAGDQPAAYFGGGFETPGTTVDVGGTTTLLSMCTDRFLPDEDTHSIMYIPAVSRDRYYAVWYINGGGMVIPWFGDILGDRSAIAALEDEVRAIEPGSEGLLFSPYFGGRQCPYARTYRGAWVGLGWGHTRAHMLRSIFESIAVQYADGFDTLERLYPGLVPSAVHSIGGATENRALLEIKASITGRSLLVHRGDEIAVRGSALLAAIGSGAFHVESAPAPISDREDERIDPVNHGAYIAVVESYRGLFERTLVESFEEIADL